MQHNSRSGSDRGDGSGGMKRPFDKVGADGREGNSSTTEEKRQKLPALASVVVEAVKMDSLQKLCSSLEPILRRVVGEEVERALARLVPQRLGLGSRTPPRQIQEGHASELRLQFRNKLSLPLFTGGKVEGDQGLPVHVVLEDASSGRVVTNGSESSAKLEVVVLDGDFGNDEEDWTAEEFESHVVKERDGKRPLLTGDLTITLKEGVGTLGELIFTDNSSWIRSRKFRLGVRVSPGFCEGIRIRECKTDAFTVKDHRGELYKKHYPPALNDEVWRLDKIGKDGAFHKRLQQNNIRTVEDFLRAYVMDQQKLRNVLGSGMSNKMWDATVEHAKTCVLSGKLYVFYPDNSQTVGVIFNNIYELMGVLSNGVYKSAESLTEKEKVYVDKLVKIAYDNWGSVTEYDHGSLMADTAFKSTSMYGDNESMRAGGGIKEQQSLMYNKPAALPQPPPAPPAPPAPQAPQGQPAQPSARQFHSMPPVVNQPAPSVMSQMYNYNHEPATRFANHEHQLTQTNQVFNAGNEATCSLPSAGPLQGSYPTGNEASITLSHSTSQSLVPRNYALQSGFIPQPTYQPSSIDWSRFRSQDPMTPADTLFSEEDIRQKTLELLENEDMQQLLRMQYAALPDNFRLSNDNSYMGAVTTSPTVHYADDGNRSSGKAYVGWLKLKAALRWGIFIRKIVAEKAVKRARLEELED